MTIEKKIRGDLVKLLRPIGAYAVENGGCHPGTPDIATTMGPIEVKATEQWPARTTTVVQLDHPVTQGQRIFLMKWDRVNGCAWVMLNIAGEWLLFEGIVAAAILGGKEGGTRAELYESAAAIWECTPKTDEIISALERHPNYGR